MGLYLSLWGNHLADDHEYTNPLLFNYVHNCKKRDGMKFEHIIYLDTNLLPAGGFYRNLMTEEHMEQFGEKLMAIFQEERNYYTKELFDALQKEFDYSKEVMELNQKVYAIYGDRNQPEYSNRVEELMLPNDGCALMIYIAKNISIGTMEEFIVRGLFLSLFIHCWRKQRRCDCKAVMISSLIFSLAHLGNLLNNDINSVLAQIIYAFFLGVYFAVVTLRSNNIWPGILIHGMIDFVGDIGTLMNTNEDKAVSAVKTMRSFSFVKVIENTGVLMTLPLFVYAIILLIGIRKESRNEQ